MTNRLSRLIRKVEAERRAKIRPFKRPWLNLVRLVTNPCKGLLPEYGYCIYTAHTYTSKEEDRKKVARGTLYVGGVGLLVFFVTALFVTKIPNDPDPSLLPAFAWMARYWWVACIGWFVATVSFFQLTAEGWSDHAHDLARARKKHQDVTLGTLLTAELKQQIEAARKCLLEGGAGLLIWQKRVEDRLNSLPATEVATLPPPEGDHPYHTAARLTVVQTAADQADLYAIAGAYRGLNFRIAEIITAYNALAEILGQSIDRRDELGRSKGTDFDPRKDMAHITQEVNGKLDQIFADLKDLQREVSALNGRAEGALSQSVVKSITKAIAGVRIGRDDPAAPAETVDAAAPSGAQAQERQNGR